MRAERRLAWNAHPRSRTARTPGSSSPSRWPDDRCTPSRRHPRRVIDPLLRRLGVLSTAQLADLGPARRDRDAAVREGRLVPVRRGWFATADADDAVVAAVRAEGCVSCASALRLHGAWVPEALGAGHVRHARHRREQGRRGCAPYGPNPPVRAAVDDIETAFRSALRCGSAEDVVVIADSLLHLRRATRGDLSSRCSTRRRRRSRVSRASCACGCARGASASGRRCASVRTAWTSSSAIGSSSSATVPSTTPAGRRTPRIERGTERSSTRALSGGSHGMRIPGRAQRASARRARPSGTPDPRDRARGDPHRRGRGAASPGRATRRRAAR